MYGLTQEQWRDLILSVGTHQKVRRLKPLQVAHLLKRTTERADISSISDSIGIGKTMINRFLKLLSLPSEVQPLIIWGSRQGFISFTTAIQMERLVQDEDVRQLAHATLLHGFNKMEVRSIAQSILRAGMRVSDAIDEVLKLRPEIENQALFVGEVPQRASATDRELRDRLRKYLAKKVGAANVVSVSVNEGRFIFLLRTNDPTAAEFSHSLTPQNISTVVCEAFDD